MMQIRLHSIHLPDPSRENKREELEEKKIYVAPPLYASVRIRVERHALDICPGLLGPSGRVIPLSNGTKEVDYQTCQVGNRDKEKR